MKTTLALTAWLLSIFPASSQNIFHVLSGQPTEKKQILNEVQKSDVLILGEEHNDLQGHKIKLELIRYLYNQKIDFALSLEMLEKDNQVLVDEYIAGSIDRPTFLKNCRNLWKNHKDYQPILDFARAHKISVLAANTPQRYTKLVSKNGIQSLKDLPETSRAYLPAIHSILSYRNPGYEKRFFQAIHGAHGGHSSVQPQFMLQAQYLWDATMADSIAKYLDRHNQKIIHINGSFHSDYNGGVYYRLSKMGFAVVSIRIKSGQKPGNWHELQKPKIADFLIMSGE